MRNQCLNKSDQWLILFFVQTSRPIHAAIIQFGVIIATPALSIPAFNIPDMKAECTLATVGKIQPQGLLDGAERNLIPGNFVLAE